MGEAGEGPEIWIMASIPKLIFLSIAILVIVILTSLFILNRVQTDQLEVSVFFNRLMYSENALMYKDPDSGMIMFGVIDLEKLNSTNLERTISFPSDRLIAAKLSIGGKTVYYHEEWFENYAPLGKVAWGGAGGVDYVKKQFYINYIKDDEINTGLLTIEIVRPRS